MFYDLILLNTDTDKQVTFTYDFGERVSFKKYLNMFLNMFLG